jgi:hypothetical protein
MLVSISAAKVELYEWFTYYGRKKSFENHHSKYDLNLEPKDKFGIRKVGSNFKLIDSADVSVLFTLTEKEASFLIKKSKGFGGKVNGTNVKKGAGGLDPQNIRARFVPAKKSTLVPRKHVPAKDVPENEIYPEVNMPVTRPELHRLFNLLNKKYFNNVLSVQTKLIIINAYKVAGNALTEWMGDRILKQAIRISKNATTNKKRLVNTLLHEMVHLHHKKLAVEQGKTEYDENNIRNGHGPLFVQAVKRLNALGFEVPEYTADMPVDKLDLDLYTLIVYNNDSFRGVYSNAPFKEHIQDIIGAYGAKVGHGVYTNYAYGKTRDPFVTKFPSLTKKFTLNNTRKKFTNLTLNPRVHDIIKNLTGTIAEKIVPKHDTMDVSENIKSIVQHTEKVRVLSFLRFATIVMLNSGMPEYKKSASSGLLKESVLDVLTEADRAYLFKFWQDTPDSLFMKLPAFKREITTLVRGIEPLKELHYARSYANLSGKHDQVFNDLAREMQTLFEFYFKGRKTIDETFSFITKLILRQKLNTLQEVDDVLREAKRRINLNA